MNMLNQATLTGFKVYRWNERLRINNISEHQGLFVVRRAQDKLVQRVLPFNLDDLVMRQVDIDGYFSPNPEGRTFFMALTDSQLFERRVVVDLTREINLFLLSCFRFDEFTICCYPSSRLVFVADISYNIEAWRSGYTFLGLAGGVREDEGAGSTLGGHDFHIEDDVEDGYTNEMVGIVEMLRMFCNTARTFPIEPLCAEEPLGLIEEEKNLDIAVFKESEGPYECSICLDPLAVDQVVLKTSCGHVYHKNCSLPWFSSEFTCPMCRSSTISIL